MVPARPGATAPAAKRGLVLRYGQQPTVALPRSSALDITSVYPSASAAVERYPEAQIREALRQVGKLSREDELNCGGCGYNSCREFAAALLCQKAERAMCVTYMRKLALKKANALIQKMPSAVVIVNDAMRIIELNAAFAALFGKASAGPADAPRRWRASCWARSCPLPASSTACSRAGRIFSTETCATRRRSSTPRIFTIEKHCVVGGILQDITEPAVRKAEVIRKAREVIQHSLATTQKIACLLGENAAESEITLNSIIESFSPAKIEEPKTDNDWRKLYRTLIIASGPRPARSSRGMSSFHARSRRRAGLFPSSPTV